MQAQRCKIGDRVVTSGEGGVFPPGLPVGVVAGVDGERARVEPYVELSQLDYVLLVDYGSPAPCPIRCRSPRRGGKRAESRGRRQRRAERMAASDPSSRRCAPGQWAWQACCRSRRRCSRRCCRSLPLHIPGYAALTPAFTLMAVYHWTIYRPDLLPALALCSWSASSRICCRAHCSG